MRVLLTGASGFVGSHLLRLLATDGRHEVAALLRASSGTWRIADLLPSVNRIEGDLDDLEPSRGRFAAFAPEVVIHLAWKGVGNTARNDVAQAENIPHTLSLVRLAHEAGAKAWVGLGSQAEYGPTEGPIREDAPTRPMTLYGAAKLATGMFAGQLCRDLGMRFAWLRLFSAYGPMDDSGWMIPSLIQQLLRRERPLLTAGTQLWDYLYVADAARAIAQVALTPQASGMFNLGSGRPETIRSVAERIRDAIDPKLPLGLGEVPFRPDQVMHLEADIGRLRATTGWSPEIDLNEGLRRTIAWFRERL
jgi:nucleoside-diphosphate-sugar epimerase